MKFPLALRLYKFVLSTDIFLFIKYHFHNQKGFVRKRLAFFLFPRAGLMFHWIFNSSMCNSGTAAEINGDFFKKRIFCDSISRLKF